MPYPIRMKSLSLLSTSPYGPSLCAVGRMPLSNSFRPPDRALLRPSPSASLTSYVSRYRRTTPSSASIACRYIRTAAIEGGSIQDYYNEVKEAFQLAFLPNKVPNSLRVIDFNMQRQKELNPDQHFGSQDSSLNTDVTFESQHRHMSPLMRRRSAEDELRIDTLRSGASEINNWRVLGDRLHGGSSDYNLSYGEGIREYHDPETGQVRRQPVYTMVWSGYLRRLRDVQPRNHWLDIIINRATNKAGSHGIMPEPPTSSKRTQTTSTPATTSTTTSSSSLHRGEATTTTATSTTTTEHQPATNGTYIGKDSEGEDILVGPAGTPLSHYSDPLNQLEQAREEQMAEKLFAKAGTEGRHPAEPDEHGYVDGFAAIVSPSFTWPHLNLRQYDFLSLNIKTDGRPYCLNVRCRHSTEDVWVGRIDADPLHASKPYLRKKEIQFDKLLATSNGRRMLVPKLVNQAAIQSFGFSVTGEEGPFRLEIECIVAHQGDPDYTILSKRKRSMELQQQQQHEIEQQQLDLQSPQQVPVGADAASTYRKQQRIKQNKQRVNELFQQDYKVKNQQHTATQVDDTGTHESTNTPASARRTRRKTSDIHDY